jgi:hypothetical protein
VSIDTLTVRDVALLNVVEWAVMPLPEKLTLAPLTKFVPVMVRVCVTAPWPRLEGLTDVNVGAALIVTKFGTTVVPPSLFVSVRA